MKRLFMILSIPALLCSPAIAGELKKFSLDDAAALGFQKGQRQCHHIELEPLCR